MRSLTLVLAFLALPVTVAASGVSPPEEPSPSDLIRFLRGLTVERNETVRDAICVLCPVFVRGTVARDAVALWGGVAVEGHVGADAVAVGGALRISGRVDGDPVAIGGPVVAPSGPTLARKATELPWIHLAGQREVFFAGAAIFVLSHLFLAVAGSVLLGERRVAHLTAIWIWGPRRTLLVGIPGLLVALGLVSVGALPARGSWLEAAAGLAGGLALVVTLTVSLPALGLVVGRRLRPALDGRAAIVLGAGVIGVASLVPLIGLAVSLVVWIAAFGLVTRGLSSRRKAASDRSSDSSSTTARRRRS